MKASTVLNIVALVALLVLASLFLCVLTDPASGRALQPYALAVAVIGALCMMCADFATQARARNARN